MADTAERQLTRSYKSWTQFLRTAARLYKYPYNEQVMIHAQRPDATACAEYDFWNKKMGRFVRRGSTGIALIDTSGQKPQLRYVFDVADTGEREHSRPIHLWQFRAEHEAAIAAALERNYGVSGNDGIVEQMESAAAQLVRAYWADYKRDILDNIDDSYLDGYDEFNTEVQFRNAAKVSITYMLMSRCGLEPEAYLEPEDFMPVFDFNTPAKQSADYQLCLAVGGFGCRADASGRAVYVRTIYDGREMRYERTDVLGVIKPEAIPDWATERLQQQKRKHRHEPER